MKKKFDKKYFTKIRKKRDKNFKDRYGIGRRTISIYGLKLALEVYDRAKRKCELCGNENDLTIHHKDNKGRHYNEKKLPMNNRSKNLQILCRKCHGSIHGKHNQFSKNYNRKRGEKK